MSTYRTRATGSDRRIGAEPTDEQAHEIYALLFEGDASDAEVYEWTTGERSMTCDRCGEEIALG